MRKTILGFVWCVLALSAAAASPRFLDQNWSEEDRQWFYTTPQGSKLIPYTWAFGLERDDGKLWVEDLERFGFMTNAKSTMNPDGLPVGVVRDDQHLGLTCAACHTGPLEFRGTTYYIDGGPSNVELWDFLADLGESVGATAKSAASPRFDRFAKRVLGANDTPANRAKLFAELRNYNAYYATFVAASRPSTAWGRARIDAFGMIFNRVTSIDLALPQNSCKPNAPVSYPMVWDSSWQSHVQWNGAAPNQLAIERLARNVGEVLGVFAEVEIDPSKQKTYPSTANRLNLLNLEDRLADLRSPKWQPEFGAIDESKRAMGALLYQQLCISCHPIVTPGKRQKVSLVPVMQVGTDVQTAVASDVRVGNPGVLANVRKFLFFGPKFGTMGTKKNPPQLACSPLSGKTAPSGSMTFNVVIGSILSPTDLSATEVPAGGADHDVDDVEREQLRRLLSGPADAVEQAELEVLLTAAAARKSEHDLLNGLVYKARPLNGIWASAPYLHNGSVPTLWDLLQPKAKRPVTFHVGNRELDPENVGFVTTAGPDTTLYDTRILGNGNMGHETGATLSDDEKRALIEYLKTL